MLIPAAVRRNSDAIFSLLLLVSLPLWFWNGEWNLERRQVVFGLYVLVFLAGFPVAIGHLLVRLKRVYSYTNSERDQLEPIRFTLCLSVGWGVLVLGVLVIIAFANNQTHFLLNSQ